MFPFTLDKRRMNWMKKSRRPKMRNDKKAILIASLLCLDLALIASADIQSTEPNAAELVRAVRESENWIHKVDSFQLHVKSVWTTPPQPAQSKTENASASSRVGRPYKSGTKDSLEFAFNSECIRYQSGGDGKYKILRIWDGEKAVSHEQSPKTNEEHYYLSAETERLFETMFANISWLRSQPHSFWFCLKDVNEHMKYYGYPEEFVLTARRDFRGIDCYVLDWKPKEGLYYASDLSKRWYVGVKDMRLYGLVTLHGDQVDVEHYMLDYCEVAPGCWFPMKQGYEICEPDSEGKYYLKTRRDIEIVKARINEKLSEEMFQIELKEGVEVIDGRSGQRITYIYKAPLVGKAFPSLKGINIDFDRKQAPDNSTLFCFFDYEQRPSRHCITQLVKQAEQLEEKGVTVVGIQTSEIDENKFDEWAKENNIQFPVGMIEADEEKTRFTWGVKSLPWLILTDKKHIVQAEGFAIAELDERIEEASELAKKSLGPGQHKQQLEKSSSNTLGCKYLLYLPEGYGQKKKKWPMVLFLHGAGERGDDLSLVEVHGPPKIVQSKKDFPFVVVSPQCPNGGWWSKQHEVLISLLDEIIQQGDVDESRIYLTGLSMGGYGSWSLGCEYPDRFAAIAPICGGGDPLLAGRLKDLPVWAFHGAKDKTVPLEKSELMVEAVSNAGGDAKLTVYPEAGHDSWTETYNNPELYEWFLRHHRKKDRNN